MVLPPFYFILTHFAPLATISKWRPDNVQVHGIIYTGCPLTPTQQGHWDDERPGCYNMRVRLQKLALAVRWDTTSHNTWWHCEFSDSNTYYITLAWSHKQYKNVKFFNISIFHRLEECFENYIPVFNYCDTISIMVESSEMNANIKRRVELCHSNFFQKTP